MMNLDFWNQIGTTGRIGEGLGQLFLGKINVAATLLVNNDAQWHCEEALTFDSPK